MRTKLSSLTEKQQFWLGHIEIFKKSGLSRKEYCDRHGLELHNYRRYLSRYKGMHLIGKESQRRDLAKAVLAFDTWIKKKIDNPSGLVGDLPKDLNELNFKTSYQVSRKIGQVIGYSIYKKVMLNDLPISKLRRLFTKKTRTSSALWNELLFLYNSTLPGHAVAKSKVTTRNT